MIQQKDAHTSTGRSSGSILDQLRSRIVDKELREGEFLPAVRSLCKEHGVAHNTAWRALRALESEGLVRAVPRRGFKVLGAKAPFLAGPLAYVLDQENMAVSTPPLYHRLLEVTEGCAAQNHVELLKLIMAPGQEAPVLRQLEKAEVGGLILDSLNKPTLDWARKHKVPAVIIDDWSPDLGVDCVLQGNQHGGELAARFLIDTGCENISWFGQTENHHGRARYGGVCGVLAGKGKHFHSEVHASRESGNATELAREFFSAEALPDGVLALDYPSARALVSEARVRGIKIGTDVHLVGWSCDDLYEGSYAERFDGFPPPAVVWSAKEMITTALARLRGRTLNPGLPPTCTSVQVAMRRPA